MAEPDDREPIFSGLELWYIVPIAFLVAVLAVGAIAVSQLSHTASEDVATAAEIAKLPPTWKVKAGDTYSHISEETGLSVDQLVEFNPHVNPGALQAGQTIKLRKHLPPAKPKPLGPKFWTVRTGQSYGSIAAKTGKPISTLIALNPKLKPTELQPGNRVRLRR